MGDSAALASAQQAATAINDGDPLLEKEEHLLLSKYVAELFAAGGVSIN